MGNYVTRPKVELAPARVAARGNAEVVGELRRAVAAAGKGGRVVLALECYPGVDLDDLLGNVIGPLEPELVLLADDFAQDVKTVQARIADCITKDRVFGVMSHYRLEQFFEPGRLSDAHAAAESASGLVVTYGMGATLLAEPDVVAYAEVTRWEVQGRLRRGGSNWKSDNSGEDQLWKFKRGYFFEWRIADRKKREVLPRADYVIDANVVGDPRMVDAASYQCALAEVAGRPFRLVPYFDTSVWGGHWMQENFGLDPDAPNFGWSFDGVPEENSIILDFGGLEFETPSTDVVFSHPDELMGPKVHARFGYDYPIRFDYLDTMGGQNLSLQVHPKVEYAQDRFGIPYTQDESYYILEAEPGACVYLGVRDGVQLDDMVSALERAQEGDEPFDDSSYVNRIPVEKHDHALIPAGTVHAGGAGVVILEISATPYIFTFKLWDWGRLGLDGKPRPVHLGHGRHNIDTSRNTRMVEGRLLDRASAPHEDLSDATGVRTEKTGLDDLEFIETRRHWFRDSVTLECGDSVNQLNLVEGESAIVESPDGSFAPLEVHYGETFIVPQGVGTYRVRNTGDTGREVALVQAFVRNL